MKTYRVVMDAVAERQADAIDAWWAEHRPDAPALFFQELESALDQLADAPSATASYRGVIRRLLLPRSRYWVYFVIREAAAEVRVRAIWHSARGRGPRL